jgi:hypothetical protein
MGERALPSSKWCRAPRQDACLGRRSEARASKRHRPRRAQRARRHLQMTWLWDRDRPLTRRALRSGGRSKRLARFRCHGRSFSKQEGPSQPQPRRRESPGIVADLRASSPPSRCRCRTSSSSFAPRSVRGVQAHESTIWSDAQDVVSNLVQSVAIGGRRHDCIRVGAAREARAIAASRECARSRGRRRPAACLRGRQLLAPPPPRGSRRRSPPSRSRRSSGRHR